MGSWLGQLCAGNDLLIMDFFAAIPVFFKNVGYFALGGVLAGTVDAIVRVFVRNAADPKFLTTPILAVLLGLLLTTFAVAVGVIVFGVGLAPTFILREGFLSNHIWKYSLTSGALYLVGIQFFSKLPFDWPLVYGFSAILCVVVFYLLVFGERLITKKYISRSTSPGRE